MKIFTKILTLLTCFLFIFANAMAMSSVELVKTYYAALNQKDMNQLLSIMDKQVVHDINQGGVETGIAKFKLFMQKDFASFDEKLSDVIIMPAAEGKHVAAQWVDHGVYYKDYPGMDIKAHQQKYVLKGGHFFEIQNGKIVRVTTYFNEADFFRQIK